MVLGGYLLAALLHGIWNLSAATGHLIGVYVMFQVPLFIAFLTLIAVLRAREARLIRTYLSQYADAGWLSHQEVAMLSSIPARRRARMWAAQHGGRTAVASMRSFQDGASDLALLRARMVRGRAERDAVAARAGAARRGRRPPQSVRRPPRRLTRARPSPSTGPPSTARVHRLGTALDWPAGRRRPGPRGSPS